MPAAGDVVVRKLGRREYLPVWEAMQRFTDARNASTCDDLWLVEHPPVFTVGLIGKPEHLLSPGNILVLKVDRGGQVTITDPASACSTLCSICADAASVYVRWSR